MRSQNVSRRKFLQLSSLVITGATLAACTPPAAPQASGGGAAAPAAQPIEIIGWSVNGMDPAAAVNKPYQDAINAHFTAKYPNATFKFMDMGWDEKLRQNLVTALLGGTPPDVIVGENYIQPYAEQNAFLPMDDLIADIKSDMVEGTYAAAVTGGKIYGISQFTGCFGFERNPDVIEKAGLDPEKAPATWSELLEEAEKITTAGKDQFYGYTLQGPVGFLIGGILRFAVYSKTAGADLDKDEGKTPWFNNPKSEKVLTFLRQIHKFTPPGLSFNPDEGQVYSQLFKGVSAMQICGSWHVKWAKDSGLQNAKYSPVPIPDKDGIPATGVVGNVILSVMSKTKYPEESLYFCRCFQEDDAQDMASSVLGRLPSRRGALERLKAKADEGNKMFIDLLLTADLGVLPQWRKDPQKIWAVYNDLITKLLTTDTGVTQLMDEAQKSADAVVAAA
ncbi:MAG: extracellular solute-binding protein [Chloroflexi bacterium]|nr:extracellular solute-binding protein [Chloroflexota bacterium]